MELANRNYGLNCFRSLNEEHFIYASSHNLKSIEIHLDKLHITLETFTLKRINELNRLAEKYNVKLSIHNPYNINASDIIPTFRKSDTSFMLAGIRLAAELQAEHITAHIGNFYWFPVERWMRKKALNRFIKCMDGIVEQCEVNNITFALENVVPIPQGSDYYFLGDNLEDFSFLFERLNSKYFMFCLDIGHANVAEGVLPYIDHFGENIKTIHFHDNLGDDDTHLPIGKGNINWSKVARAIQEINFTGPIISECRELKPHEAALLFEEYFDDVKSK
ncbi:MAG: sugar phosphate isomerase/epimerase [Ignavibacteriae bacterium]|nr:sugar phosphate isomerase/epimerase [Ignavibacteriota bacterium]NOG96370.1 sugar phosphate isomerase/epimerase [Ignavibacteriota bacterium]